MAEQAQEETRDRVMCPCCAQGYASVEACLECMKVSHGVDVVVLQRTLDLDQIECIKLINYLRKNPKDKYTAGDLARELFDRDEYMAPVLPEDPLMYHDYCPEEEWDCVVTMTAGEDDDEEETINVDELMAPRVEASSAQADPETVESLKAQLENLKMAFSAYQKSTNALLSPDTEPTSIRDQQDATDQHGYFDGYSHYGIHEIMLKDRPRTEAYRDYMYKNPKHFEGKIVLDVGCGTGILSMFAAKAGAKHVYAIDNAEVALSARKIIAENGLSDQITVIKGRVEDIDLPCESVDIIVSEWMGYFLLFESMLDSVLFARDKWLAKDGLMVPDQAGMYIVGINEKGCYEQHVGFWDNVYDFKMSCMKEQVLQEAVVAIADPDSVCTSQYVLQNIAIKDVARVDLEFASSFTLTVQKPSTLTGLLVYFDIVFENDGETIYFTTAPSAPPTHWQQTLMYLEKPVTVSVGTLIEGDLKCTRKQSNDRALQITLDYTIIDTNGTTVGSCNAVYALA
eukprot:m.10721 g.10721  ORF g.10721 m.10721 type:complete len:512 (+) comp5606_c0_seq2:134-1669(+)